MVATRVCTGLASSRSVSRGSRSHLVEFGRHLRWLRRSRGLTQVVLADRAGLSVDAVRRIERGGFAASLDTLHKLAKGLGTSVTHLFANVGGAGAGELEAICDTLHGRTPAELRRVRRVLHALFAVDPAH